MPTYIPKVLHKFQHAKTTKPQHAPYQAAPVQYGAKIQGVVEDELPPLNEKQIKHVQDVVGTILYFARGVDSTLMAALSSIASRQHKGTEAVAQACQQLLDYCATHPNPALRFVASDMILLAHTDASYLSEPQCRSRAAAHYYLSNLTDEKFKNGSLLTLSASIKHVMASASEAELAVLFFGCKAAVPLHVTLEEMGHWQPQHRSQQITLLPMD